MNSFYEHHDIAVAQDWDGRQALRQPRLVVTRLKMWTDHVAKIREVRQKVNAYFLRPCSIKARIASDRVKWRSAAQRSTRAISTLDNRSPIIGRTPVAGRPRFFCLADIDRAMFSV